MARKPTATSSFGVSKRESHDASDFYARFVAPEIDRDDEVAASWELDSIFHGNARDMTKVAPKSVALVVTSPPYFAGKQYEQEVGQGHIPADYVEYLEMLRDVFAECAAKLEPGGRIAVNVANLGRKPFRSLAADVTTILQDDLKLLLRGEVVWQKARGATGSCAWGSFMRPTNPVLRDLTERVVIASKGRFDRARTARQREAQGLPYRASMFKDEFLEATTDVWEIAPESANRVGHPAPFPVELPERLIHLYTYYDDVVLDPFMGSGTTAIAALRTGRHFVGYDTDQQYIDLAMARIAGEQARAGAAAANRGPSQPAPAGADDGADPAWREGWAAKEVARDLLARSGFVDLREDVKFKAGVDVGFAARDDRGRTWLFDVAGGFTSSRPGLKRADVLWKALGKAGVLHAAGDSDGRLVVLAADVPPAGSAAAALKAMVGPGRPIHAVVDLRAADAERRLRECATGAAS
jgi:site-specific DNA-methyltransferase (adenine-specific)